MEPLISVAICTYNQEQYISQAIDSVLNQDTIYPYEIVIGEDCSTDKTREIINKHRNKYSDLIRIVAPEKNVGVLKMFYLTVSQCKGKYISLLAGDDFWHNKFKLQKQISFLEQNQEYGLVNGDIDYLFEKEGYVIKSYFNFKNYTYTEKNFFENYLTAKYNIIASTISFRKNLFDKYYDIKEYLKQGFLMEDAPLFIEIGLHSKVKYLNESFITKRFIEGSLSKPKSIQKLISFRKSHYKCLRYFMDKYGCSDESRNLVHLGCNTFLLKLSIKSKNKELLRETKKNFHSFIDMKKIPLYIKIIYYSTANIITFNVIRYVLKFYEEYKHYKLKRSYQRMQIK